MMFSFRIQKRGLAHSRNERALEKKRQRGSVMFALPPPSSTISEWSLKCRVDLSLECAYIISLGGVLI